MSAQVKGPVYVCGLRVSGPQVVYLLPRGEHFKIGCTANLTRRYPDKKSRDAIFCLIEVPDEMYPQDAERMIHAMFPGQCVDGFDTYDLSETDIEKMKRMRFKAGKLIVGRKRYGD